MAEIKGKAVGRGDRMREIRRDGRGGLAFSMLRKRRDEEAKMEVEWGWVGECGGGRKERGVRRG